MAKHSNTDQAHAREAAAEWVDTMSLVPWDKNPRNNDDAVKPVMDSIKRFGFAAPIIARRENGEIVAGHTRWKAAQALGLTKVPVRFVDLDPADAHLLAIADNKLNEKAEWDDAAVARILSEFSLDDAALAGFDAKELDRIAAELVAGSGDDDSADDEAADDVPEMPEGEPVTKPGDVWVLGDHRIMCGDCRNPEHLARLLGGQKINVAFTSPPYASQRKYDESSGFKPIHPDEFVDWFDAVQANVRAHLAPDGSWFVNIKEHCEDGQRHLYVKDLTIAHVRLWGWAFIDELCWVRGGVPGKWPNRFKNAWEPVFHFAAGSSIKLRHENVTHETDCAREYSKDNIKTHSGFISGSAHHTGDALPSNVVRAMSSPSQIADDPVKHAATFPVGLPEFFVKAFSDAGDVVFDPFMGSGTTLVACERTKRSAFGTEISPKYCDLIVRRWEALTGKKATLDGSAVQTNP